VGLGESTTWGGEKLEANKLWKNIGEKRAKNLPPKGCKEGHKVGGRISLIKKDLFPTNGH